jgi:hypothetical protein
MSRTAEEGSRGGLDRDRNPGITYDGPLFDVVRRGATVRVTEREEEAT